METNKTSENDPDCSLLLNKIRNYLPGQQPLSVFNHQNSLHGFLDYSYFEALNRAQEVFGYHVFMNLDEFRRLFREEKIDHEILDRLLHEKFGNEADVWKKKMLKGDYDEIPQPRIGQLRKYWQETCQLNMDEVVHPILFRLISSCLDQGIAAQSLENKKLGLLEIVRDFQQKSFIRLLKSDRAVSLLKNPDLTVESLLKMVVGYPELYENYLFDQQFAHPGWSGMVHVLETNPQLNTGNCAITLRDFVVLELILEIDALESICDSEWFPLGFRLDPLPEPVFNGIQTREVSLVKQLWKEAYEWTFFDNALNHLIHQPKHEEPEHETSFQALMCMDDRIGSIRRHLEYIDKNCITYGTAGHFNLDITFQPAGSNELIKVCPGVSRHLIREIPAKKVAGNGWLFKLSREAENTVKFFFNAFYPKENDTTCSAFKHMHADSELSWENKSGELTENGLQVGYTLEEMVDRLSYMLQTIGFTTDFAPVVYTIGHGSTVTNNAHFVAFGCGACQGRPGSVNARIIARMANKPEVRAKLREKGIDIPDTTQFIGGIHDTSRDLIEYFDLENLSPENKVKHEENVLKFNAALDHTAKERARRFDLIDYQESPEDVHREIIRKTHTVFDVRPELGHARNVISLIGQRSFYKHLYFDRRAFMYSYEPQNDLDGVVLADVLSLLVPVAGNLINNSFSRVDPEQLGAGSALKHDVVGLLGVTDHLNGDLRTGLPFQMVETHDPLRNMVVVNQKLEIVEAAIHKNPGIYKWFKNEWLPLIVVTPETQNVFVYKQEQFIPYEPLDRPLRKADMYLMVDSTRENIPVFILK